MKLPLLCLSELDLNFLSEGNAKLVIYHPFFILFVLEGMFILLFKSQIKFK